MLDNLAVLPVKLVIILTNKAVQLVKISVHLVKIIKVVQYVRLDMVWMINEVVGHANLGA